MSVAYKILPHYTYEDYCQWEGRWEVIEGIPYAMSPAPIPKHQLVAAEIKGEIRNALKKSTCKQCRVYDFIDFILQDDTILQPDGLVVCGDITKKFLDFVPALVLEVLSPATALKDRNTKFHLYKQAGVPYYLIADIDTKTLEIYQLINGQYQLQPQDAENSFNFIINNDCNIVAKFATVFD